MEETLRSVKLIIDLKTKVQVASLYYYDITSNVAHVMVKQMPLETVVSSQDEGFDNFDVGSDNTGGAHVPAKIQSPVFEEYKPEVSTNANVSNPTSAIGEPQQRRLSNVSNVSGYRGGQDERRGSNISQNMVGFFAEAGLNNSYINGQGEIGDAISQRRGTLVLDGGLVHDSKLNESFHSQVDGDVISNLDRSGILNGSMLDTSYVNQGNDLQMNPDAALGGSNSRGNPLSIMLERDNEYENKEASFRDEDLGDQKFEQDSAAALSKSGICKNANFLQIDNTSNNSFQSPGQLAVTPAFSRGPADEGGLRKIAFPELESPLTPYLFKDDI